MGVPAENNGLPFFNDGSVALPLMVLLDKASFDANADQEHKDLLQDSISANLRWIESIDDTHEGIIFFTDNTGHLAAGDVAFASSLLGTHSSWNNSSYQLDVSEDFSSATPSSQTTSPRSQDIERQG